MRQARAWNWRVDQQATHGSYKNRRYGPLRVTSRLIEKAKWRTQKDVCIEEQIKDKTPGMSIPSQHRKSWHPYVQTNHQMREGRKKDFYSHWSKSQERTKTTGEGAGSDALCLVLFWNPLLWELASCLPANGQAASVLKEFSDTFLCLCFYKENRWSSSRRKYNYKKKDQT